MSNFSEISINLDNIYKIDFKNILNTNVNYENILYLQKILNEINDIESNYENDNDKLKYYPEILKYFSNYIIYTRECYETKSIDRTLNYDLKTFKNIVNNILYVYVIYICNYVFENFSENNEYIGKLLIKMFDNEINNFDKIYIEISTDIDINGIIFTYSDKGGNYLFNKIKTNVINKMNDLYHFQIDEIDFSKVNI